MPEFMNGFFSETFRIYHVLFHLRTTIILCKIRNGNSFRFLQILNQETNVKFTDTILKHVESTLSYMNESMQHRNLSMEFHPTSISNTKMDAAVTKRISYEFQHVLLRKYTKQEWIHNLNKTEGNILAEHSIMKRKLTLVWTRLGHRSFTPEWTFSRANGGVLPHSQYSMATKDFLQYSMFYQV